MESKLKSDMLSAIAMMGVAVSAWAVAPAAGDLPARNDDARATASDTGGAAAPTDALIRLHRQVTGHYAVQFVAGPQPHCCEALRAAR